MPIIGILTLCFSLSTAFAANCGAERKTKQLATNLKQCASLSETIRHPSALPLAEYQNKLGDFLRNYCHRDAGSGWVRDKNLRDTGPYTVSLKEGEWVGQYHGTHAPVIVWYSPEMITWLEKNRPVNQNSVPPKVEAVPDGAVIVKEMYPAPAAACTEVDPEYLLPTSGAAIMVRDKQASKDGWFSGWFGWSGWNADWPANSQNRLAYMGFGQYCANCHASASDNMTFASLENIQGYPGKPPVYLSQYYFKSVSPPPRHQLTRFAVEENEKGIKALTKYNPDITGSLKASNLPRPNATTVVQMPSETYDNVWMPADGPKLSSQYLTSDQCIGCHDAGSTGLQFDMTSPDPHSDKLINQSPYATWRTSPMGLAGRDPIFFAQLASETETFHPENSELIQNGCMGCHGILGQRQYGIDTSSETGNCENFKRSMVDAIPWPEGNSQADHARYGALARDGISCTSCHHMVQGEKAVKEAMSEPQNTCVKERQDFFNPDEKGFARTFTGSFPVGPADTLYGPFKDPKTKPMQNTLGIKPEHNSSIQNSQLCGSCHTVHLPVLHKGDIISHIYEQTTFPEWAFSDYRTGITADGARLPSGKGTRARSCQSCHMPSRDENGNLYRSKIASIQENTTFPQTSNILPASDIDLSERDGFALHTLVGLNVFLVKMAQQFPEVLGIRTQDPMLVSKGVPPLVRTERAMLDQAAESTAEISISEPVIKDGELSAKVTVLNKTGHKFPSGTGFRRAFVHFEVLNKKEELIWASGRTDGAGVIIDQNGKPVLGELWWDDDCSARISPEQRLHQPHFQTISRQDQIQIYQELVSTPPATGTPQCGEDAKPEGQLTTSFLSICADVKDNRLLPHGFLPYDERLKISAALGAGADLAADVAPTAIGGDPDYAPGGGDSTLYRIKRSELTGQPAFVRATLYYQAVPPFYLQDRFCTSQSKDTQRLYYLVGHLNLKDSPAEQWKLKLVETGKQGIKVVGSAK